MGYYGLTSTLSMAVAPALGLYLINNMSFSRLFRAVAEAETIHAIKHLETAGKVGSIVDNVRAAIEGETYE